MALQKTQDEAPPRALLLCTQPGLATAVLYCLQGMGASTVVVGTPNMRFTRWSRFCDAFVDCSFSDTGKDELIEKLNALCRQHRIDLLVPGDHDGQAILSELRDDLVAPCFPMPTESLFETLNDKWQFHQLCQAQGVLVPETELLEDKSAIDPDALEARFGYPVVVKPTNEGNGDGVVIARSRAELQRQVLDNPDYTFCPLISQEFIPGSDIDFSLLSLDGKIACWAVQTRRDDEVAFLENAELVESGRRLVDATGLSGAAHFDARIDERDGSIAFIECNSRFWASICHAHWCGMNFVARGLDHVLGRPVDEASPIAGKAVRTPARLLTRLITFKQMPWRLTAPEKLALRQGLSDPASLLLRSRNG